MEEQPDKINEEREDYMVSPHGDGKPTFRTGHFLKPSITSIDGPIFKLSSHSLSSANTTYKHGKFTLKVAFNGWRYPQKNWKSWVDRLSYTHRSTWKKASIYEAIMASTYRIQRSTDLVFGFAQKWCSETNTFIFPWGEATISLEDVMILGGYSVLGDSVLTPLETEELKEIEEKLIETRLQISRTKARKASQHSWIGYFMEDERELEHEAFLSLWLSRFVFPNARDVIIKHVFPIAIHLARGTRIALAPAVLAAIYRDLSLLKASIVASTSTKFATDEGNGLALKLWAPLHFVQIWAWERFVTLRPKPDFIEQDKPRLARWNMKDSPKLERLDLNSLGECFQWRPYTPTLKNWPFPKFYGEMEERVMVDSDLDIEFESFVRCLRVSELVGIDCIEQYLPHRVAMQFGMDQDLPGLVARCNESPEAAWNSYTRPITDVNLYIPSRLFESDVTSQYAKWWKKSVLMERRPKTSKGLQESSKKKKGDNDASVPPGFPPKSSKVEMIHSVEEDDHTLGEMMRLRTLERRLKKRKRMNDASDLPGFPPKLISVDTDDSVKKTKQAMGKKLKFSSKQIGVVDIAGDGKCLSYAPLIIQSSSTADNEPVGKLESTMKPGDEIMNGEASMLGSNDAIKGSKENNVDMENSVKENELVLGEMLEFSEKQIGVDHKAGNDKCVSDAQSKSPSSFTADNGVAGEMRPGEEITHIQVSSDNGMEDQNESETTSPVQIKISDKHGDESNSCKELTIPGLELEARINKLDKFIAGLKAYRQSRYNGWMT